MERFKLTQHFVLCLLPPRISSSSSGFQRHLCNQRCRVFSTSVVSFKKIRSAGTRFPLETRAAAWTPPPLKSDTSRLNKQLTQSKWVSSTNRQHLYTIRVNSTQRWNKIYLSVYSAGDCRGVCGWLRDCRGVCGWLSQSAVVSVGDSVRGVVFVGDSIRGVVSVGD